MNAVMGIMVFALLTTSFEIEKKTEQFLKVIFATENNDFWSIQLFHEQIFLGIKKPSPLPPNGIHSDRLPHITISVAQIGIVCP